MYLQTYNIGSRLDSVGSGYVSVADFWEEGTGTHVGIP